MYTEDKHLLLTKLPVDTLGASPKFTQTLSYLKLNCRPAWLPLKKHFMHLLREQAERGAQTTTSLRLPLPDPIQTLLSRQSSKKWLEGMAPAAAHCADLRNSCMLTRPRCSLLG